MLRVKALVTLVSSSLLLAACGQLIGLSDYEEVEGDASGRGGKGGGAGNGGSSGKGGSAGSSSGAAGDTGEGGAGALGGGPAGGTSGDSGTAGESGSSGVGGTGGAGGEGGASAGSDSGGSAGSDSGGSAGIDGGSGGEGGAPARNCTEITAGTVVVAYDSHEAPSITRYYTELTSPLATADLDYLNVEFYDGGSFDGGLIGTFDLGTSSETQYASCARCVLVFQDDTSVDGKLFFQESGTLVVEPSSDQMNGLPDVRLENVTLIEVTIADDFTSTPVPGGDCVHIEEATLTRETNEVLWSCRPSWYGDSLCDCGCLTPDPDCSVPTSDACPAEYGCWCPEGQTCNAESNWLCDSTTP